MSGRWLVTGGAGFIGGHLVRYLAGQGLNVRVLDNFSTGHADNLLGRASGEVVEVQEGDANDLEVLNRAVHGVAGVFHCAATVSVQDCIVDWLGAHRTNSTATLQLFDAARRNGNIPVVYASSSAVYGDRDAALCHEELPERPLSPYGADKLACENHARAYWQVHGLPSAGLRLFNVYGPGQRRSSPYSGVLAQFSRNIAEGRPHVIYGDGRQTRDFVYVGDVVTAMTLAMAQIAARPGALVSNVCTGRSNSVLQLARLLGSLSGTGAPRLEFRDARHGDIRYSHGDTARMQALLGLGPMVPLERGLVCLLAERRPLQRVS